MKVFGKEIGKTIKFPPVIGQFISKLLPKHKNKEMSSAPSTNISDGKKAFEFSLVLPRMDIKEVKMEVKGNYLTICANALQHNKEKAKNWIRTEFVNHWFYRAFKLPNNADPNKVYAKMNNGRLEIKVGKRNDQKQHRSIAVS